MPSDEVDEIRRRIDIVKLISQSVSLKPAGKSLKGLCPFHEDKNPSFHVSPSIGRYRCWACGESGDVFTWVMKTQNVEFKEALRILAAQAGVTLKGRPEGSKQTKSQGEEQSRAMESACAYFRKSLDQSTSAKQYLLGRGLDESIWKEWEIGYAPDVDNALATHLSSQGISLTLSKEVSLVDKDSSGGYFDRFRGRVMFAIRDDRDRLVGFGGRALGDRQPKYINSAESRLFRKSEVLYGLNKARNQLIKNRTAILVEGYLDVIACSRVGAKTAVAPLGTAFTEDHARLLARWADKVLILFDGDNAGQQAALKAHEVLRQHVKRIRFVVLEAGKDPDNLLQENRQQVLIDALKQPVTIADFELHMLSSSVDPSEEEFWERATVILAKCQTRLELEAHLTRLAGLYPHLRDPIQARKALEQQVRATRNRLKSQQVSRETATGEPVRAPTGPNVQSATGMHRLELLVLASLLDPDLIDLAWRAVSNAEWFTLGENYRLGNVLYGLFGDEPPQSPAVEWIAKLEPEDADVLMQLELQNGSKITRDELKSSIDKLEIESSIRELKAAIEAETDATKIPELLRELQALRAAKST
ncbi:MAG: DNA primase [Fimbriimonadaceae bacterium]